MGLMNESDWSGAKWIALEANKKDEIITLGLHGIDDENKASLTSQRTTPLVIHSQLPSFRLFQNKAGRWVYDFGQNFSGIFRTKVRAGKSNVIRFLPSELLNDEQSVDQSAVGSPVYFQYTFKGYGTVDQWQPQFTYYGFRYIEIEGAV